MFGATVRGAPLRFSVLFKEQLAECLTFCAGRRDSVGDDVVWGGALRLSAASGSAGPAGEGRATVPAPHLYHRRLHGYG